jgi:hypothetical protein
MRSAPTEQDHPDRAVRPNSKGRHVVKSQMSNLVGIFLVLDSTDHEHYRTGYIAAAVGNIQFDKGKSPWSDAYSFLSMIRRRLRAAFSGPEPAAPGTLASRTVLTRLCPRGPARTEEPFFEGDPVHNPRAVLGLYAARPAAP